MALPLEIHKSADPDGQGAPEQARTLRPTLPEFVMTPTAQRIFDTLAAVHEQGQLGVVRGPAGLGKTTAIRRYARETRGVHVFTVSDMARSKRDVLAMLCDHYEVREHLSYRIMRSLVQRLRDDMKEQSSWGVGVLIIIDEAQHLTRDAASLLRSLSDASGAGFVFAGNRDVLRDRHRSGRSPLREAAIWTGELEQVLSRMRGWCELERQDIEDVSAFLEACGVGRDRRDLIAYLAQWATKPGGIRNVQNLIAEALRTEDGWPFSREGFSAAAEFLGYHAAGRFG